VAGALDGITVLEMSNYVSGPYATMLLGDLGATVIKVEPPDGDPFRGWGTVEYSPTFGALNRNKKSVVLDLKQKSDLAMARGLVSSADVLVQNFRPGTMERMGLGYDQLSPSNKKLIYCSITGFGNEGPYRDYPGYDTVGQGMSGLLSLLTEMDNPKPMGISLSDHLAGIFACYGILAALVARAKTGRGQHVQTSLIESSIAFLAENAAGFFERAGAPPSRATRTHLAQVFALVAGDGLPFVIHLSSPPKFWQGLLKATGLETLATDERFSTRPARIKHYDELAEILTATFATGERANWLERLRANDVPCGPMNNFKEVFDDPHVQLLGMKHTLPHPTRGSVDVVGSPVRLSDTPVSIVSAAPALGADTGTYVGIKEHR
jgi:crotonobetainyl-CoA:carnitine CoA-transferase CaiB-like acyl-CoA transferase